jgi:heme-degrading monooxygenase HmoA
MKSPWKSMRPMQPGRHYVVLASSIPPRSRASTRALFAGASAVRKQLANTEGVIGFSLLARPVRKQYATLSVWEDDAALETFATSEPHAQLMADLGPEMAPTTFVRWNMSGGDNRPSWRDALERLSNDS